MDNETPETTSTRSPEKAAASHPSRWPIAFAVVGVGLLALIGFVFHSTRSLPGDLLEGGRSLAGEARSLVQAFHTGTVTTSFTSFAAETSGSNFLQFASLKETEVFERTDKATVFWGQFALPDVVVRAEAPVETTYYLDLNDRWEFLLDGNSVLVRAPRIRHNTPALDVSRIRYEVKSESLLRNEEQALANLQRGLTSHAAQRADENVELVRELGRRKTEEFIRNWLLSHYDDADSYRIEVRFADELDDDDAMDAPRIEPLRKPER